MAAFIGIGYGIWLTDAWHFLGLVFIWLTPQMTVNRLALFAALSVYLYVGTFFEERQLIAEFGPAYREYQRQVPRLFPYRGRVDLTITTPAGDKGC